MLKLTSENKDSYKNQDTCPYAQEYMSFFIIQSVLKNNSKTV